MKKGDLVKGKDKGTWMFDGYGIGIVLAVDGLGLGSLKVYWPLEKFWCITMTKNVEKI